MKRVFLIVLDSCGVGYEPDAAEFGAAGANTLHTCSQSPKFAMPNLISMGLGNLDGVDYLPKTDRPQAALARLQELSRGKDTTIGHWEIAGLLSAEPLATFPDGFPQELLDAFTAKTGYKVLCNKPYSGTEVIRDYGADALRQKQHDADVALAEKLQDYVDRNLVRASTTKMAQSRRRQLEKLEITEAPQAEAHQLNFRFEYDIEPYDELVIMKGLTIRIGERTLLEALDYVVHRGDKLIIAGPNGTGKSTLLQVLDGKRYGPAGHRCQARYLCAAADPPRRPRDRCHLEPVPPLYRAGSAQPPGQVRIPRRGSVQGLRHPFRR